MPNLKNATKQPDLSSLVQLLSPAPQVMPLIPNQNPAGLPASGSRGPAPSIWTTAYDSVRQWTQPATSQVRFPPLPTKANPQVNAQAASVAKTVVSSPSTSGVSVGLDIPNIFTPTTQLINLPGTLAFGLALEKQGQVLAVPPPLLPNLASLDFNTSSTQGVGLTISATANYQDAVFLWAGSNGTITGISSGWTQAGSNPLYYGSTLAAAGSTVSAVVTTGVNPINTITAGVLFGFPATSVVVPNFLGGWGGALGNVSQNFSVTIPSTCKAVLVASSWDVASPHTGASVGVQSPFPTGVVGMAGDLIYQSSPNEDLGQVVVAAVGINPPTGSQTFTVSSSCGVGQTVGGVIVAVYDITGISTAAIEGIPQFMYLEPNQIPVGGAVLQAANYTAQVTDSGTVQYWLNNGSNTFYLPATGPPSTNWFIIVENYGSGTLTINGNGYTIGGSSSITASQNQGYMIFVSGPSTYIAVALGGSGGGGSSYYQTVQQAGSSKPQEAKLNFLAPITAADNSGNGSTDITVPAMVGDSGSGGTAGLVPAPGAGTAAAGDYLNAGGTWTVPPGVPPTVQTLTITTSSLANGASENDTPAFPKCAILYKVTTSQACRVELYATSAARTADRLGPRPISTIPASGTQHGVLFDLYIDGVTWTSPWLCSPPAVLMNGDSPQNSQLYSTITNYGATGAITVVFYYYIEGN